jgi:hypothetical protein
MQNKNSYESDCTARARSHHPPPVRAARSALGITRNRGRELDLDVLPLPRRDEHLG